MYLPRKVNRKAKRGESIKLTRNLGPFIATRSMKSVTMEQSVPMSALRYIGLKYVQLIRTARFSR